MFVSLGAGVVFGELSIMNIPGSKMGNRRSANIRSVGYSDLFSLSKDDLWETLEEYPDARRALLDKGREILLKDNMIDEEAAKLEAAAHQSARETVDSLERELDMISEGLADIISKYKHHYYIASNVRGPFGVKLLSNLNCISSRIGWIGFVVFTERFSLSFNENLPKMFLIKSRP